jgi:hypothetical protein
MPESFHFSHADFEAASRRRRVKDRVVDLPDGFTLCMSGRSGYAYYRDGARVLEVYVEYSGVPQYDFLVTSEGFAHWVEPSHEAVDDDSRSRIEQAFRAWMHAENTRINF